MAGRPGRSGGHNKLAPEVHLLRGTFNATRHGAALAALGPAWRPTAAQLAAIGPAGRKFIHRLRAMYDMGGLAGETLLELAIVVDRLAEVRAGREADDEKIRAP